MYQCPDCGRNIYCSRHVCDPDLPDSQDIAAVVLGGGVQPEPSDPRLDLAVYTAILVL